MTMNFYDMLLAQKLSGGGGGGGDDTLAKMIDRSITSVVIPDGVAKIGQRAFANCNKLSSAIVNEGVTDIESNAFNACSSLLQIELPSTIKTIASSAFASSKLSSLTIHATTPPSMSSSSLPSTISAIYVPSGSVDAYKARSGWSDFASKIQAIPE